MIGTYSVEAREGLRRTIAEAIVNKVARARGSMVTIRLRDLAIYANTSLANRIRSAYEHNPLSLTFTASQFNRMMGRLVKAGIVHRINGAYIIDRDSPIWGLAKVDSSKAIGELLTLLNPT